MHIIKDLSKWPKRFLALAKYYGEENSKDPSTKVGAVISKGKVIVSLGFNGFPQQTNDDPKIYKDRETKYLRVIHAEMNAILFAKRDLTDCHIHVSAPVCSQCMAAIIQTGIKHVYAYIGLPNFTKAWEKSTKEAGKLAAEAGVQYHLIDEAIL